MIFRQLFDPKSSTYSYLLADSESREALIIDCVFEQAERLLIELGLTLRWLLETHVHADHVTGASLIKAETGAEVALSVNSAAEGADRYLEDRDKVRFGGRYLEVRATPGHTGGCLTYVLDDKTMAFTGDCLLIRGRGRKDFQEGDAGALYRSVHEQIFTLPETYLLYSGHDYRGFTVTSVAEEKSLNPRLGGKRSEQDFIELMKSLNLAYPKMIDVAMPANLNLGKVES